MTAPDPLNIKQTIEYFQIKLSPDFDQYTLEEFVASGKLTPYFLFNGVLRHDFTIHDLQGIERHPQDEKIYYQYSGYISPIEIEKLVCLSNIDVTEIKQSLHVQVLKPDELRALGFDDPQHDKSYLFTHYETSRTDHKTIFTITESAHKSGFNEETGVELSSIKCRFIKQHLENILVEQKSQTAQNIERLTSDIKPKKKAIRNISQNENLTIIGSILDLLFVQNEIVKTQEELIGKLEGLYLGTKYISESTLKKNFADANSHFKMVRKRR